MAERGVKRGRRDFSNQQKQDWTPDWTGEDDRKAAERAGATHIWYDRDHESITYSKAQLLEGDTLVVVKFPRDEPAHHPAGFEIRTKHILHYDKLVASGSQTLINILNSREQQLRLQRRLKLVGRLPEGIKYLLDLTPPEEGDEAVNLTVLLSCPLGVRKWHTIAEQYGVPSELVNGTDELLKQEFDAKYNMHDASYPIQDAQEYDQVRHRTGIERLLQVIEGGKDPRLDSAPKIWTLVMLAHSFGCAKVVEDHVLSWLLAEPNNRFTEVFPEAALKIGIVLENEHITKHAFSILVSEQALTIGDKDFSFSTKLPEDLGKDKSRMERSLGDVDEDWTNLIQYAAQSFAARVHQQARDLLSKQADWMTRLPEYQKLFAFEAFLRKQATAEAETKDLYILYQKINHFVRGRLAGCIIAPVEVYRRVHVYSNQYRVGKMADTDRQIQVKYECLNDEEKVLLHQVWSRILALDWSLGPKNNSTSTIPIDWSAHVERFNVEFITVDQLIYAEQSVNSLIDHAIRELNYGAEVLSDAVSPPATEAPTTVTDDELVRHTGVRKNFKKLLLAPWTMYEDEPAPSEEMANMSIGSPKQSSKSVEFVIPKSPVAPVTPESPSSAVPNKYTDSNAIDSGGAQFGAVDLVDTDLDAIDLAAAESNRSEWWPEGLEQTEPVGRAFVENTRQARIRQNMARARKVAQRKEYTKAREDQENIAEAQRFWAKPDPMSSFFSLEGLFSQIQDYLSALCTEILSNGSAQQTLHNKTVLGLSEKEFAFLPLWAGGMNDGSGGVFAPEVPFAERGAPNQPGPSYHTGSTMASAASSKRDFDGERFSFVGGSSISEGGDTSMGVENGESDHLPRDVVVSVPSEDFSLIDSESDVGMAGMEDARGSPGTMSADTMSVASVQTAKHSVVVSEIEDDDGIFFNESDDIQSFDDEDDAMDDSNEDEGEETETDA